MQLRLPAACLILLLMVAHPAGANSLDEIMGEEFYVSPLETPPDYDYSVLPPRPRLKMRRNPLDLSKEPVRLKPKRYMRDDKKAYKRCLAEAKKGTAVAQYNLGVMYEKGIGVSRDYKKAVHWCRLSAEQSFVPAQYNLGLAYFNGEGVPQDFEVAYAWWAVAADSNHQKAFKDIKRMEKYMSPSQIEKAQQLAKAIWARINK